MLTVIGTGYGIAGQVTAEALASIQAADKLLYLVADPVSAAWLRMLNPTAESLDGCYRVGRHRSETYEEMVERIMTPVRSRLNVCAGFYGHPGVFCAPAHEAVRRARREGFTATMLPGISALDCLIADLEIEPAFGMQSYEATDFVENRREHDPRCMLILWQAGAIGVRTFKRQKLWSRSGIQRLVHALRVHYAAKHEIVIYESAHFPTSLPVVRRTRLDRLEREHVTIASTLYVAPK